MLVCDRCKKEIVKPENGITSGYGQDSEGNKVCYSCCAELDIEYMLDHGKIALYLSSDDRGQYSVTNWPSSLVIPVTHVRKGRHNMARYRYDVWFNYAGELWHGTQYGDNTQICHCKRSKQRAA